MIPARVSARYLGLALCISLESAARAAEVKVTNDAGKPVANAMIGCMGRQTGAALTGEDGVAALPDNCTDIYCERGDLVPDQSVIKNGKAECRLRDGLLVTVEIDQALCGEDCYAVVRDPRYDARAATSAPIAPRRADGGRLEPGDGEGKLRRRFHPLIPGRYRLQVGNSLYDRTWWCATDLGELPAGERVVNALWRKPVEVRGRVLDREGKPAAEVPLFVRPEAAGAGADGAWICSTQEGRDEPVTAEDGSFGVLVDPAVSVRIDAGWEGYPIGTATASVHGAPDRELVLRLK